MSTLVSVKRAQTATVPFSSITVTMVCRLSSIFTVCTRASTLLCLSFRYHSKIVVQRCVYNGQNNEKVHAIVLRHVTVLGRKPQYFDTT